MNKSRTLTAFFVTNILFMIFGSVANGQIDDEVEGLYIEKPKIFSVGVLAGGNFCQIDGDSYAGYHKAAFNFGGIGYARIYRHVALSFEMLYSQKGAKSSIERFSPLDSMTVILKYGINLNYAEIPILINYFDKRKSHFGLGVSVNRLVGSSETMETVPVSSIDFTKYPFRKESYDLLANADMHMWKGLFLNIRFQYALTPVRTTSPPALSRSQKQFSNLWTVRLMYLFI